jgi:hypothetical protein
MPGLGMVRFATRTLTLTGYELRYPSPLRRGRHANTAGFRLPGPSHPAALHSTSPVRACMRGQPADVLVPSYRSPYTPALATY